MEDSSGGIFTSVGRVNHPFQILQSTNLFSPPRTTDECTFSVSSRDTRTFLLLWNVLYGVELAAASGYLDTRSEMANMSRVVPSSS